MKLSLFDIISCIIIVLFVAFLVTITIYAVSDPSKPTSLRDGCESMENDSFYTENKGTWCTALFLRDLRESKK